MILMLCCEYYSVPNIQVFSDCLVCQL
uniref:Uncharacterized protein n=1 Tax=Arundo donax TaxID=35708 RepID=A0A0A8YRU8_ARUDO